MNKKKIISQLASVTLLTSTLIATAGTVNPDLVSVRGWADGNEVLDVKITGDLKLLDKEPTQLTHRDTFNINVSIDHKIPNRSILRFRAKNINVDGLNRKDIRLKDGTKIRHIIWDNYPSIEFNGKNYKYDSIGDNVSPGSNSETGSSVFTTNLNNLSDANKALSPNNEIITDFYIYFIETVENYENLEFSFGLENNVSEAIASNTDRTVSYSIESNNKTIIQNQYSAKGLKQVSSDDKIAFLEQYKDYGVMRDQIDWKRRYNRFFGGSYSNDLVSLPIQINSNSKRPLKNGDKIILKSKANSNFKFDTTVLSTRTFASNYNDVTIWSKNSLDLNNKNSIVNENGAYISKRSAFELGVDKVSPDELVLSVRADLRNNNQNEDYIREAITNLSIPIIFASSNDRYLKNNFISDLKVYVSTETSNPNSRISNSELDVSIPITTYHTSGIDKEEKKIALDHKITQWVEEGSVELLKPSVIENNSEKETRDFSPAGTIEGYEFVRTDTNADTNTQTHVFRKIKAEPVKELKTISKDENGLVIKTEKGSGSPTDLSGYKFLEETTDKDGNKVRTYHKIVTKAVATVNGKEVVLNVKDGIVPNEKIDGYSFSERKVDPKTGDVIYIFKKDGDNSNNSSSGTNGNNGTSTANSNSGASASGSSNETGASNSNSGTSKESSNNVSDSTSSNNGSNTTNQPLPVVMKDENGNVIKSGLDASTSKEIPGYKLIKEEKDKAGNVVYTYHKIVTKLVALENGKEVVIKDKVGDLTKEEIPGYKFEKEEKSENGDTRFIYSKVSDSKDSSKKTIYKDDLGNLIKQETGASNNETLPGYKLIDDNKVDENGNKVVTYHKIVTKSKATIDGKEVTLLVKDRLDSNPASIPGFAYSETKTDPETGDLIYYYTDRTPNIGGKLAVYKDEQGNVFLTAKGEIPEVDEKLYKLLKTETDEDGNQVFTYHRIVTNYTTVIDGKEDIIKTNLGETPKEEIPGYKFDKTEKDDKTGDLKQVYTKDLKTADKKEAVKTGASASKIILPIIGLAGLGGLVGFIAKRKSKK